MRKLTPWISVLFLLIVMLALRIFLRPLGQDEGVFLTIGQGIAKGLLPYRDFFDHKPPGIYLLVAGLYQLFGSNIIGYQIFLLITQLASAGIVFLITNKIQAILRQAQDPFGARNKQFSKLNNQILKICHSGLDPESYNHVSGTDKKKYNPNNLTIQQFNNPSFFAAIFFLFLSIIFEGERFIAEPFVALYLLIAVLMYLKSSRAHAMSFRGLSHNIVAGIFLGLALLFKQTAILSVFAFCLFLIFRRDWKNMLMIFAGMIIPLGATLIYLLHNNLLPEAYRQIIFYNFKYYPNEPLLKVLSQLLPCFFYTLPIWIILTVSVFRNRVLPWIYMLILLLAILPIFAYFGRHYPHYWLQSIPFVAILSAQGLGFTPPQRFNLWAKSLPYRSSTPRSLSLEEQAGVIVFTLFITTLLTIRFVSFNYPRLRDEQHLTSFIRSKNQCIYIENQFVSEYFLADRQPLSKYLYVTEITEYSENSGQITLETLRRSECLVIWPVDLNYAYAEGLQGYITSNYRPIFWSRSLGAVVYEKSF